MQYAGVLSVHIFKYLVLPASGLLFITHSVNPLLAQIFNLNTSPITVPRFPSMPQEAAQGQVPPTVDSVYEVPDADSARRVVADRVRNNLLSVQIRSADRYNDQSRNILQQCVRLLPLKDQERIQQGLRELV